MPLQLQSSNNTRKHNYLRETKHTFRVTNFCNSNFCGVRFVFCNLFFFNESSVSGCPRFWLVDPLGGEVLEVPGGTIASCVCDLIMSNTYKIVQIDSVPPCELSVNKTSACGNMHWLVNEDDEVGRNPNRIISFDFKKEELFWTPHPNIHFSRYNYINDSLNLVSYKFTLGLLESKDFEGKKKH
ncbi:unnamed protein product [Malus baccata var. baccata]